MTIVVDLPLWNFCDDNTLFSFQGTYHGYRTGPARILGIIQIICGIVVFFSQIVITSMHSRGFEGMSGFWAAILVCMRLLCCVAIIIKYSATIWSTSGIQVRFKILSEHMYCVQIHIRTHIHM